MDVLQRNHVQPLAHDDESAPVLLYAHGFGCNQEMWHLLTPAFASGYRQILFDYVGSGYADPSAFDPLRYNSLEGYVQDLLDVCDALNLTQDVIFVGHSISCSIGILASIQRPELFSNLVLVGPSPCFLNDPPDYLGGFERADLTGLLDLMNQNYIGWAQTFAPLAAGQPLGAPITASLADSFCSTDPVMARLFAEVTFFSDIRAKLQHCIVPSLILQHRVDSLVPLEVGSYLHSNLKNSHLETLDVTGHCAHLSHPALVATAMHNYLSRIDNYVLS